MKTDNTKDAPGRQACGVNLSPRGIFHGKIPGTQSSEFSQGENSRESFYSETFTTRWCGHDNQRRA